MACAATTPIPCLSHRIPATKKVLGRSFYHEKERHCETVRSNCVHQTLTSCVIRLGAKIKKEKTFSVYAMREFTKTHAPF